ncbi:hypothetical protein GLOTRDRAFT_46965 [Gloeophyllum trabeum ATCC 11539]|uniref:Uncharacterized protein n=1 Tax=Gloeophyllum trabeum (strain ATCC 11539 / FP-39264 / Madison 617) TaxID=670483 RepID=S7PYF9_GLOTA|nr:uncharacterized protein GLOTRDRAFT_46965 [Gloeophyllum trabeum ATCC 11539]EPQ52686.1 hypothetical protein GLOTRDRAFT_46965 [Gloeophyllum trabeum ATCC 11539]
MTPVALGNDDDSLVVAVLVGSPSHKGNWLEVTHAVTAAFMVAQAAYHFSPSRSNHRRGAFPSASFGISHGGGRTEPGNVSIKSKHNIKILHDLFSNPYVQLLLGFTDQSFNLVAPRLHSYYSTVLGGICSRYPNLERFWRRSVFACCAFNLGPRVRAYIHTDHLNVPFGWCAITAFGRFDPKRGGHLILWEWGLIIEFPPGSTVFIPSALVRHSNIGVSMDETRFSLVQWMPGALCRWFDFGFKPAATFRKEHGSRATDAANEARWKEGLSLLPRLRDFRDAAE